MELSSRRLLLASLAAISLGCGQQGPARSADDAPPIEQGFAFKGLRWQRTGDCSYAHTDGFRAAGMAEVVVASRQHHVLAKVPSDDGLRVSCPSSDENAALPDATPLVLETPTWSTKLFTSKDKECLTSQACKEKFTTSLRKSLSDSLGSCSLPAFNAVWRRTESGDNVYIAHVRCGAEASAKAGVLYVLLRASSSGSYAGAYALSFKMELPPRADDEILMNLSAPGTFQVR